MVHSRSLASLICAVTLVVALGALAFSGVLRAYAGDGLYAAQTDGNTRITIDGKAYTSAAHGAGESGTWDWDGQKKLTLTNFTGDSIMASGSLNVTVNGNVSLKYLGLEPMLEAHEGHGVTATGEYLKGDVSIAGGGKLALSDGKAYFQLEKLDVDYVEDPDPQGSGTSGQTEVMHWDSCLITATNVTIESSDWGILAHDVAITNGSTVVANGPGLKASGKLSIIDSSVENDLEQYKAFGGGDVLIERSTVTVKGQSAPGRWWFALDAQSGSVDIMDSVVSIIGGASGLYSSGLLRVQNSDVTIQGQKTHNGQPFAALVKGEITLEDVDGASIVEGDNCKSLESAGCPEGTVVLKALGKRVLGNVSKGSIALSKTSYTYDGEAKTPGVTVKIDSKTLTVGADYTLSYKNNTNAGTATVTVTGQGNYTGTKSATFQIGRASIKDAAVTGLVTRTYTGGKLTQSPKVEFAGRALKADVDYALSYANNVNAGTATVTVTGKGNYSDSVVKTFKIAKAANPLKVVGKKATVKHSKRKAQAVKASKAYSFKKKAAGKVTYSRVKKGSSKWLPKVNAKTGAITVKAGAPKGKTQSVKVKVTAKGNGNYKSASKVVTVKVRVK